tara:strand:- start:271 stop:603 length:333 start_codon:yes stop_codon:yes gene_type:complete
MDSLSKLSCAIENEPGYSFIMSFILGILFSEISFGLVYVILFLILWEFLYFAYLHANYKRWHLIDRVLIILGAVLGFLLGRFLHEDDDHAKDFDKFQNDYEYYGKQFGWF